MPGGPLYPANDCLVVLTAVVVCLVVAVRLHLVLAFAPFISPQAVTGPTFVATDAFSLSATAVWAALQGTLPGAVPAVVTIASGAGGGRVVPDADAVGSAVRMTDSAMRRLILKNKL